VKRAALAIVAAALACSSNPSTIPAGDFSGPSGLAVAPLTDRDLLFIANQGSNELRALNLCHTGQPSCGNQDLQFLPGPIRVFAGSILTGERPVRLAGIPLSDAQITSSNPNPNHGAVLVTSLGAVDSSGATVPALQLFDAANLFAASQSKANPAAAPQVIPLADPPVDVVASTAPNTTVTAFAVSQPSGGSPTGTLSLLTVTVAAGLAQATLTSQCALDFAPTRLALIPGRDDFVYVADGTAGGTPGGTGDGMVEIATASIAGAAGGACPIVRRIPASDPLDSPRRARPLKSIAISPASFDAAGHPLDAGNVILGVTLGDPALCANHSFGTCTDTAQPVPAGSVCLDQGLQNCGDGRVLIFSNTPGSTSALKRAPGMPGATNLPMQPLRTAGAARDIAFMGRRDSCVVPVFTSVNGDLRCTALRVGAPQGTPKIVQRSLIGVVSTVDGTTLFLDIDNVRFFDDIRDSKNTTDPVTDPIPFVVQTSLVPSPPPGAEATQFMPAPADPAVNQGGNPHKQASFWMNGGVSRSAQWRAVWHPDIPGLESVGATMTQTAPHGPITLTLPSGKDLTPWITSPELQFGQPSACTLPYPQCVGDFVRVLSYSSTPCGDFAVIPSTTDIPIMAVTANTIVIQPQPGFYDPAPACFSATVGGTFEVHIGDTVAGGWLVLEDNDVLGRVPHGGPLMIVSGTRFDYPLSIFDNGGNLIKDANGNPLAQPSPTDIALAFSLTGPEPTFAGTIFTLSISSGASPTSVRDITIAGTPGYAGPILVYSSTQRPNDEFLFTGLTGSNSLLFAVPAQFGQAGSFQIFY
jgi:hypothetical protein